MVKLDGTVCEVVEDGDEGDIGEIWNEFYLFCDSRRFNSPDFINYFCHSMLPVERLNIRMRLELVIK